MVAAVHLEVWCVVVAVLIIDCTLGVGEKGTEGGDQGDQSSINLMKSLISVS